MSKKQTIGGQAVIEGVMMRAPKGYSVAVRCPDNKISVKTEVTSKGEVAKWKKLPIIRGALGLVDSMYLGVKCIMHSSNEAYGEEEELSSGAMWLSVIMGIGGAVLLFMVLPTILTGLAKKTFENPLTLNLVEGVMRITIFVLYVFIIGRMPDIKRVFQYHGAEHKSINCLEDNKELTVENAQKYTTLHVRCGTAFMLLVMIIAVFIFSLFGWQTVLQRILTRIILLPLIAGLSYELIKLAGNNKDSKFWRMILAPGLWMQRLTTAEPDDSQVEVALTALKEALKLNNDVTGVKIDA
ncbi:DUF1385 domain-containing protein [Clostridium sp. 'deep sea']|uniref:DUF1385 domain-containing protein n=1 Tax=Clostridium sp. 'deep sea' TaxID=2779445 RepID=UPI0018965485|nr:DUF1385 domain-containing protein [Clostridium sp. 'deep sea']QOR34137.1 DUF1385 domain-containing protein [Clostridium sp. 'deep sea']